VLVCFGQIPECILACLAPVPAVFENVGLTIGSPGLRTEDEVVILLGVERRVEIDQVDALAGEGGAVAEQLPGSHDGQ
jgi:hypothetical protein